MSWELVETNTNGWKHYIDSHGNDRFQKPNGQFAGQNQWNGSLAHAETESVEREEEEEEGGYDGPIYRSKNVIGEVKNYKNGIRFMIDVAGVWQIRTILEGNPWEWQGFQVRLRFRYECSGGSEGEVIGHSRIQHSIKNETWQTAIVEDNEFQRYGVEEGDTVDRAFDQAESNAWASVGCSIEVWELLDVKLLIYTPEDSTWNREAKNGSIMYS